MVSTMLRLRSVVDELNQNELDQRGLSLRVVYDETKYISSAIDLVQQNIWIGGMLAFTILMLFSEFFTNAHYFCGYSRFSDWNFRCDCWACP